MAEQLYVLRTALASAHHDGALDGPVYAAARTELDEAISAAPAQNEPPANRFLVAMRKFNGLVSGSAELAKAATAIIALAQGSP
ncbi:hypothetical protein Asp14428_73800 [Actinoplanes sp. NBRC 14428]|nr:hypothetical protein Asp14428_73800 [Actinoplanes sp. NBRC 14428]